MFLAGGGKAASPVAAQKPRRLEEASARAMKLRMKQRVDGPDVRSGDDFVVNLRRPRATTPSSTSR